MTPIIAKTIELVTPAPPGSLHGNRMTAMRWERFLKNGGLTVQVSESWSKSPVDLLIALHAFRSHPSITSFKNDCPQKPILLVMTGTDLYRDLPIHAEVSESMEMAHAIVVLQSAALASIPKAHHDKTHVIYQSIPPIQRHLTSKSNFVVSVIGHLRPEKDPFCTAKALAHLPSSSHVQVIHLGKAMGEDMQSQAQSYAHTSPRYKWLGELSHQETLEHLARSHLMVISSVMEGGAHVVSEAISAGVPVIASDIPGNRGLLGDDYPGYYPVGDELELAKLLLRSERDPLFYQALEQSIQARQKYVMPEFEQASLNNLVQALLP